MATRKRPLKITIAVATCFVLAACGSEVPPQDFFAAQGGLAGQSPAANQGPLGSGGNAAVDGAGGALSGGSGSGAATGGSTGTAGSGGGSGSGGSGGGSGGGSAAGSGGGATNGIKAGSCAGFKNGPGITDSTITIANVADLSGPVPGLFKSAQAGVTAYVTYFNQTSSICGRKLKVIGLDSGTSESVDQQATTTACNSAFAMVGSMGAFDAGGASTAVNCGIPDLRTASTETARYKSSVSYGAYSLAIPEIPSSPFTYFRKTFGDAYKNAAFVYLNAGASSLNAASFIKSEEKQGYTFKDKIAIDVTSVPNYNGYATQLKGDGIKYVQYVGAYQYAQKLKAAFEQQNYKPVFVMDPTAYDGNFTSAGSAMDGTYVYIAGPLFEEAGRNPELQRYMTWLSRTSGGAPAFFGVYAWSAAALFTKLAIELGGKLTRPAIIAAMKATHGWTNQGMHPPMDVGGKHTPGCVSVIQLQSGKWVRKTPFPYTCAPTVNSGVGG